MERNPGYEGWYQVSNMGRIKSLQRMVVRKDGAVQIYKSKIVKPFINKQGRCSIALSKNSKVKKFILPRLVAQAFVPNPKNKPEVNHIDENPQNNKAENLNWMTRLENQRYGTAGLSSYDN